MIPHAQAETISCTICIIVIPWLCLLLDLHHQENNINMGGKSDQTALQPAETYYSSE